MAFRTNVLKCLNFALYFLVFVFLTPKNLQSQCVATANSTTSVVASADDARQTSAGVVTLNSVGLNFAGQYTGIRFSSVNIPRRAIITNAYIQFTGNSATSTTAGITGLVIKGQAADAAVTYPTTAFDLSNRFNIFGTANSVTWTNAATWTSTAAGVNQRTPDLKAIVQEIVSRPNWYQTAPINFVINGIGSATSPTADAFDATSTTSQPQLVVTYTLTSLIETNVFISDCTDSNGNTAAGTSQTTLKVVVDWENQLGAENIILKVQGQTNVTINPATATRPFVQTYVLTADGTTRTVDANYATTTTCLAPQKTITLPTGNCLFSPCNTGNTGGKVWRDFTNDGVRAATDTFGVAGVIVNAYSCTGALLGTTTSDASGQYSFSSFTPTAGSPVRLEFSGLPTNYQNSLAGTGNATSVQFITAAGCNNNYGINNPADYCQINPFLATTCFLQGPAVGEVLVGFPLGYANELDGNINGTTTAFPSRTSALKPTTYAVNSQIGATYGLAWNPLLKSLYVGTFIKRETQLGTLSAESTGAIYRSNPPSTTPTVFADLNAIFGAGTAGVNPHPIATTNFSIDSTSNPSVYKAGLGDLELSSDYSKLYAVNLFDRTVYVLPTNQTPTAGNIVKLPLTLTSVPTARGGTCPTSDVRVFGLGKDSNGDIYLGGTCSAQSTQNINDLSMYVWKLSGTTWNLVLNEPFNFRQGSEYFNFRPWIDQPVDPYPAKSESTYPMGIVSDIEFDMDGSMVLGIRDRFGDQTPRNNAAPNEPPYPRTVGDIIRAYPVSGGKFLLEGNAISGLRSTVGTSTFDANALGNGSTGKEYYFGDIPGDASLESTIGGLALIKGSGEVISTAYDAVAFITNGTRPQNNYNTAGVQRFSNTTGNMLGAYDVYLGADVSAFGKIGGLGDLEPLCNLQPIQIGNYVWLDTDRDGTQDPCETPLSGVKVSLYKDVAGTLTKLAEITTGSTGNYYFSDKNAAGVTWTGTGIDTILLPNQAYKIVFGETQFAASLLTIGATKYGLTDVDSGEAANPDLNDSDASISTIGASLLPNISVITPVAGSNHSYDIGFVTCDVLVTAASNTPVCSGNTLNLTSTPSGGNGIYTYSWTGPVSFTSTLQNPMRTSTTTSMSGTYALTVTDGKGCTNTATTTTVINLQPNIADVTKTCPVGGGNAVSTHDFAFTGTWVLISQPLGASTSINGVGVVTGMTKVGNYSFSVTVNGCTDNVLITIPACCPVPDCVPVKLTKRV
jgi:SdrD B-like domain